MSDILRDFDKKNETPKYKTDLADEITQALGIIGIYVSVGLINKEMHLSKLDFSEHDKVFEDKIAELEKQIERVMREKQLAYDRSEQLMKTADILNSANKELKQRIAELESKETEKPTKINLNDRIKVKLTPLGAEIYYHQYDELNKRIKENGETELEPIMPQIDKDGYTKFQLWHFMELYGEHIGMCKPNVIIPLDIIIVE